MAVLKVFVLVLFFASAASMILFILLHAGRGGGLSGAFGSSLVGGFSGPQIAQKNLDRITIISAATFTLTTVGLIFFYK